MLDLSIWFYRSPRLSFHFIVPLCSSNQIIFIDLCSLTFFFPCHLYSAVEPIQYIFKISDIFFFNSILSNYLPFIVSFSAKKYFLFIARTFRFILWIIVIKAALKFLSESFKIWIISVLTYVASLFHCGLITFFWFCVCLSNFALSMATMSIMSCRFLFSFSGKCWFLKFVWFIR